ncbi:MAG: redox-regulated ATPase YchF [Deltaproteobacteria bacterium]|nr:redox-regulated ATPase YchF [Deltaproteobacteria bacterium]
MGLNCGIVGLPNVGKSTLFNALTNAGAESANYPFCTIEPNKGIVTVPDQRLQEISARIKPKELIPTAIEFVDIAGLVKGASKGEGLGNQFLGNIKSTDAVVHVVRCFEDSDVVHVDGNVDPIRDIETIKTELMLADLESVDRKIEKNQRLVKGQDKHAQAQQEVLLLLKAHLEDFKMARSLELSKEQKALIRELFLITIKPYFYVCNVDEAQVQEDGPAVKAVKEYAQKEGAQAIKICGKLESEMAELGPEEKKEFLSDYGLELPGLELMARTAYDLLDLITYFTAGEKEVRAWTIHKGDLAPQAAGVIHSDFEKGFIKAEVYHYNDLVKHGTVAKLKEAGLYRLEGKDYLVKDGDVMLFKFNV